MFDLSAWSLMKVKRNTDTSDQGSVHNVPIPLPLSNQGSVHRYQTIHNIVPNQQFHFIHPLSPLIPLLHTSLYTPYTHPAIHSYYAHLVSHQ